MIKIVFNKNENKSIAYDDNTKIGECDFEEVQDTWNIFHTEVDNAYQGQGIARNLIEIIAQNAKSNNKKLIASCSYAKKIISK